jgi:hypothetical protein
VLRWSVFMAKKKNKAAMVPLNSTRSSQPHQVSPSMTSGPPICEVAIAVAVAATPT